MTESSILVTYPGSRQVDESRDNLLSRCLAGAEAAFVAVYNEYAGIIYRLCYGLLQHRQDSEEVLQDAFDYAFRKLDRFDPGKASFKTWLYQIAISRCRNKRRRKWLKTLPLTSRLSEQITDHSAPTPQEISALDERQQIVWEALGRLSPKLRETVVLRYYDGLTYKEIGLILSIPPKTAESRMRLAHQALRKLLADDFSKSERDEGP
jgi:RNA polymerase sigma-70 factor (ECF subfamily)